MRLRSYAVKVKALELVLAAGLVATACADCNRAFAYPAYSYEDPFLQAQEPPPRPDERARKEAPMDSPQGTAPGQGEVRGEEPGNSQAPQPASRGTVRLFESSPPKPFSEPRNEPRGDDGGHR